MRKRPDRAEADRFFNYPYVAIEEALVNAVYHRSYEEREPIEVRVLPDRITIASFPGPDRSIRLTELQTGAFVTRRYRNRRVGEFLKELHLTEGRGTGVPKILHAMEANGSPPPEFRTDEDRTYFAAILPVHPEARRVHEGYTPQVTPQVDVLSETARALLDYCRQSRSRGEIETYLDIRDRKHLRERYLQPMLERGLLEMTQPESPRSPTQGYRSTALGLSILDRAQPT